mgnify:FL=1
MKDLYIIPECYIDTNLVESLIATEGCNHQKGCNTVVSTMQKKFADSFSVGIIDNDKRQVKYVSEFSEIAHTSSLSLKKHHSKSHYLIMVTPAMDGFLLKCAEELDINMEEYGYTSELKEFTSITKSVTSKNDSGFKKLFKVLNDASEMIVLKKWLKYLKENQYQSKEKELQEMAK